MSKRAAKRQAFAARQKRARLVRRITKANSGKPGFLGVATSFRVTLADGRTEVVMGAGALFLEHAQQ